MSLQDFGRVRCDFSQSLLKRGCKAQFIEFPSSTTLVLKSYPLSSKGSAPSQNEVTQIMPQKISVSLRPGQSSAPIHHSLEPLSVSFNNTHVVHCKEAVPEPFPYWTTVASDLGLP